MNRLQKAAILLSLVESLGKKGSWCGETHVQKATYFLQELLNVPLEYDFILYKYGPYSFDMDSELTQLQGDDFLRLVSQPLPYGPSLKPGLASEELRKRFPKTIKKYNSKTKFIAKKLGPKQVSELERLATALFVTKEYGRNEKERAKHLCSLKPHVNLKDAEEAIQFVDSLADEAQST